MTSEATDELIFGLLEKAKKRVEERRARANGPAGPDPKKVKQSTLLIGTPEARKAPPASPPSSALGILELRSSNGAANPSKKRKARKRRGL